MYVEVYIEGADKKGLQLKGFERGVVPIGPKSRTFEVKIRGRRGMPETAYHIKRYQLPNISGTISSVHRAQGENLSDCLLDLHQDRRPRDMTSMAKRTEDNNSLVYPAVSRATSLESLDFCFLLHWLRCKRNLPRTPRHLWRG